METISTERLILRPLKKASPRNLAWLRDKDVVRFSEQRHREHTLSTQLRYVESFKGKSSLFAIWHVRDNEYIGNISVAHDEENNIANIGIMLGESAYWGKRYASEAWQAVCGRMLQRDIGIRKLEAGCMRSNLPMVKIMQRSGFKQEGELLNHFLLDGAPVSALLFGRMK